MSHVAGSNISCGIQQLYDLSVVARQSGLAVAEYLRLGQTRFILFSDNTRRGNGGRLEKFITEKNLGKLIVTDQGKNPNSGNQIILWVWEVDPEAIQKEYAAENQAHWRMFQDFRTRYETEGQRALDEYMVGRTSLPGDPSAASHRIHSRAYDATKRLPQSGSFWGNLYSYMTYRFHLIDGKAKFIVNWEKELPIDTPRVVEGASGQVEATEARAQA